MEVQKENCYEYLRMRIVGELRTGYRSNVRRAYYHGMVDMANAAGLLEVGQASVLNGLVIGFDESED